MDCAIFDNSKIARVPGTGYRGEEYSGHLDIDHHLLVDVSVAHHLKQ